MNIGVFRSIPLNRCSIPLIVSLMGEFFLSANDETTIDETTIKDENTEPNKITQSESESMTDTKVDDLADLTNMLKIQKAI